MKTLKIIISLLIAFSASAFAGDLTPAQKEAQLKLYNYLQKKSMSHRSTHQTIAYVSVVAEYFIGSLLRKTRLYCTLSTGKHLRWEQILPRISAVPLSWLPMR